MPYRHVTPGRWHLGTWCSVNNLRLAVSLSTSEFLSLAGSTAATTQHKKKQTRRLQSSTGKKPITRCCPPTTKDGQQGSAGALPCASLSVGTSSSSSSSPRRFLGCWGQRWSRPPSTCLDAASRPTLPSVATGRPNSCRATIQWLEYSIRTG